jgi:large subunit ribosomal protein L4
MDLNVKTLEGKDAGTISLSEAIFGLEPRQDLIARMVRYQLAKRQQGTHETKTRGEISRTGKKMYKQKGTGRARHASARAPQFRGGGRAHGPVTRSHAHDLPKKIRALALRHALSAKLKAEELIIVDDLVAAEAKTKSLLGALNGPHQCPDHRWCRARQQLQARCPEHPEHRRSAGSGHQRV